ncbi:sigma-54-dependent transcriptional regulator [Thermodesulfobacteriota bacterium]
MHTHVIVVDDEQDFLDSVKRGLLTANLKDVACEINPKNAADFFTRGGTADVALIDVTMPEMSGVELLEMVKQISPETECIMITAVNDARTAVACLQKGAYDYLTKPVSREDLAQAVNRAIERKHLAEIADLGKRKTIPKLSRPEAFSHFTTQSIAMARLLKEAELHAGSDVPVLITGETGTGKELLARAIHRASRRASATFTPVNMAAITPNLFDAEFFGHTKGAFTGAEKERTGYLEVSNRGTLFLDEIGTLSHELQGKLLRALQEQEFYKVGSSTPRRTDVRFVAATNADLERLMRDGSFRKDLYYRIKGAWLHLPALRERKEDLPVLVQAFLDECTTGKSNLAVAKEALDLLTAFDWPGNVRELKSIVQSAVNLAGGGTIKPDHLPENIRKLKKAARRKAAAVNQTSIRPLAEIEKEHILRMYELTKMNKTQTAEMLDIGLNTLRRKLQSYGIE